MLRARQHCGDSHGHLGLLAAERVRSSCVRLAGERCARVLGRQFARTDGRECGAVRAGRNGRGFDVRAECCGRRCVLGRVRFWIRWYPVTVVAAGGPWMTWPPSHSWGSPYTMVDVESSNACVLDIQGRIECWGPSPAGPPPPVPDPTGSGRFVMVAAGPQGAACAVTRAARLLGERVAYGQQWRVPCHVWST
jgi:hypothetical protein